MVTGVPWAVVAVSSTATGGSLTGVTVKVKAVETLNPWLVAVTVMTLLPNWFNAGVIVSVRVTSAGLPPKVQLPDGNRVELETCAASAI